MGSPKRSKRASLIERVQKGKKGTRSKLFDRLYHTNIEYECQRQSQKKFFQTHTPIIESELSNNMFSVYFIVIICKFSILNHYSPP